MAVGFAELMGVLDKTTSRLDVMQKTIDRLSGRRERDDMVVKTMLSGGKQAAIGFDGADTLGLVQAISCGRRQKALNMGRMLDAINVASGGKSFNDILNVDQAHKALDGMGCRPVQKTALAESAGYTGGYTVPVQFYADFLRLLAEEAFVRKLCTTIPMQSRTCLIPALDQSNTPATGTSAFFGGIAASWQPEGQLINESEPTFRQVELVARDLVFHTVASNQLLQDNAVALDTLLTTLFMEAMAWFTDYYILRGNGANQPLGVLNAPATYAASRATNDTFTLVDAAGMIARLLVSSWSNAIWMMHPSLIPQLIQMNDGNNGRLVWINQFPSGPAKEGGGVAQQLPASLFGIPIYFTEKLPVLGTAGDVVLADLSKMVVGDRLAIQIETSPHVKFLYNQMVWRIIMRFDAQPWLNSTIKMAGGGAYEMSPFVKLAA